MHLPENIVMYCTATQVKAILYSTLVPKNVAFLYATSN